MQMRRTRRSSSYLEKLLWLAHRQLRQAGRRMHLHSAIGAAGRHAARRDAPHARSIGAPHRRAAWCRATSIADEILTDHPKRYRAMLVESGNPAHSLADRQRMREAIAALELLVVIDVAMTETARLAHYVLPASSQFEKGEATFFNFEFPRNDFHLRAPVARAARPARCPSPRSTPGSSRRSASSPTPTRAAARGRRRAAAPRSRMAFLDGGGRPIRELGELAPVVLYGTLGPTLPDGAAAAALLGARAAVRDDYPDRAPRRLRRRTARAGERAVRRDPRRPLRRRVHRRRVGRELGRTSHARTSGSTSPSPSCSPSSRRSPTSRPRLDDREFPFVLTAGERRSFTANTIIRDPAWRKKDAAARCGSTPTTPRASASPTASRCA